jgi:hypothetical protein
VTYISSIGVFIQQVLTDDVMAVRSALFGAAYMHLGIN